MWDFMLRNSLILGMCFLTAGMLMLGPCSESKFRGDSEGLWVLVGPIRQAGAVALGIGIALTVVVALTATALAERRKSKSPADDLPQKATPDRGLPR